MQRRDFFKFGKKGIVPKTNWEMFLHRVQRLTFSDIKIIDTELQIACIEIKNPNLAQTLISICADHQVAFIYDKLVDIDSVSGRPILLVKVNNNSTPDFVSEGVCVADFTCLCGDLFEKGFNQFEFVPPELNLSQWFNEPSFHDSRPYYSITSGLMEIDTIFSNAMTARLGGFGLNSNMALGNALLNKSIPELFKISQTFEVTELLGSTVWPDELRFDSLFKNISDINLCRVFLGQRGSYIWGQRFYIKALPPKKISPKNILTSEDEEQEFKINPIDLMELKEIIDPQGIFQYEDEFCEIRNRML